MTSFRDTVFQHVYDASLITVSLLGTWSETSMTPDQVSLSLGACPLEFPKPIPRGKGSLAK